jgi:hypothetical protein
LVFGCDVDDITARQSDRSPRIRRSAAVTPMRAIDATTHALLRKHQVGQSGGSTTAQSSKGGRSMHVSRNHVASIEHPPANIASLC